MTGCPANSLWSIAMNPPLLAETQVSFSHWQVLIYDSAVANPCLEWTEGHSGQGFARKESALCLGTLLQAGDAVVRVYSGQYTWREGYQRVLSVPFFTPTGRVIIHGLMEFYLGRVIFLQPQHYLLIAAQRLVGDISDDEADDLETIELYFAGMGNNPATCSQILTADEGLNPPNTLLEDADEMQ